MSYTVVGACESKIWSELFCAFGWVCLFGEWGDDIISSWDTVRYGSEDFSVMGCSIGRDIEEDERNDEIDKFSIPASLNWENLSWVE